jgi:hypothetical protein
MNWSIAPPVPDITVYPCCRRGYPHVESRPEALQYMYRKSSAKPKWLKIAAKIERKISR